MNIDLLNNYLFAVLDEDTLLGAVHLAALQVVDVAVQLVEHLHGIDACSDGLAVDGDGELRRIDILGQLELGAVALHPGIGTTLLDLSGRCHTILTLHRSGRHRGEGSLEASTVVFVVFLR